MKHSLIGAGRSLAITLLVALGLSAYGCGDSATINPEVELSGLSVNTETATATLEPPFSPGTTSYTVNLSNSIQSVSVGATAAVSGDSVSINVDGQPTSGTITLKAPGTPTIVQIVVSESTTKSRTYTVAINRSRIFLSALSISDETSATLALTPSFDPDVTAYKVGVTPTTKSVTVSATKSDPNTVLQIGSAAVGAGTATGQGTITLSTTGLTTSVSINVTAPNGPTRNYTIDVSRGPSPNTNLGTLTLSSGKLSPSFKNNIFDYQVNVASNVASVTISASPQDKNAKSVTINGRPSPSRIDLGNEGSTTPVTIIVIAQNDDVKPYTLKITRNALGRNNNLQSLTVSPGDLTPSFSQTRTRTDYALSVDSNVGSVTVNATPEDKGASDRILVNGSGSTNPVSLPPGPSSTEIEVRVKAQNGAEKSYFITVNRAAPAPSGNNNLRRLTVSSGTLVKVNNTQYRVDVDTGITSVTVTATLQDTAASMTINGQGISSGVATAPITLGDQGSSTDIPIVVTAPNGDSKTYTVTVKRAALAGNNNLRDLTVSSGTLVKVNNTQYRVDVDTGITSVTVTATLQDTAASMTINGQGISSGVATAPITLGDQGSSTDIPIVVTAPNGDSKTYTITVNRAEPTAPLKPSKPDLITQDDTCLPTSKTDPTCDPDSGTTNTDDKTNVRQPRFKISLRAGETTPRLYVDGKEDKQAEFDTAANTLKPGSELSEGDYSITYTVTNAANLESPPSDSLKVHIDATVAAP